MKILVTGATGFIGKHLCRYLRETGENKVIGLDKKRGDEISDFYFADITEDDAMQSIENDMQSKYGGIDACVHLAAIAAPRIAAKDPKTAWDINVRGTQNVLGLCKRVGIRKFVFASSAHVYGISPRYIPTNESHPLSLLDTYTTTKIAGEKLCELFHQNYDLSTTILRLFNVYGPGQSDDYFMGVKLKQAKAGGPLTLMNGDVTKDWIFIDDVVKALCLAIHTEYVGPLNIGTGIETSLAVIARQIGHFHDLQVIPEAGNDNSPTRMACDNHLARTVLNWKPEIDIGFGLRQTIVHSHQNG